MPRRGYRRGGGGYGTHPQVSCEKMVKHRSVCCDLVFAVLFIILLTIDFLMMDTYQETIDETYILYLLDLGLAICSIMKAGSWIPTPCYGWWILGANLLQFFIGLAMLPLRITLYISAIPSSYRDEDKDKDDPNAGIVAFGPIFFILGMISFITWNAMGSNAALMEQRKNSAVTVGGGTPGAVTAVAMNPMGGQAIIMMQPYPMAQPAPMAPAPVPVPAKEKTHEEVLKEQEEKIKELENQQKIMALEGRLKEMEDRQNMAEEAAYYPPPPAAAAYGQPYYDPNAPPYDPNAPPYDPNYPAAPPAPPPYYPPPSGEQVVAPPNHAGIS